MLTSREITEDYLKATGIRNYQHKDPLLMYTDEQLKQELERRQKEKDRLAEEEKKARQVEVVCPKCDGEGKIQNFSIKVATREEEEWRTCSLCKGNTFIIALRTK